MVATPRGTGWFSAAALNGAKWVDAQRPAEIVFDNRHPPAGVRTYADRLPEDEVGFIDDLRVTTPERTALDLACRYRLNDAVTAIDSLARATNLKLADVELLAERHRGRRGIRQARRALNLVDPRAESPRETWLRLLLIRAGFPRPQTQISVYDEFGQLVARLDMGWEDIRIAVEYDGDHHRTSRRQFADDIRRMELLTAMGWIVVRISADDTPGGIAWRVGGARSRRV